MDTVTAAGATGYTSIDPTTTGLTVPPGYVIQPNAPAYNIVSSSATSGNFTICLEVQSEFSQTEFGLLKILHEEGGALVDRTFSSTYIRRQICARVMSFARFVLAKNLVPTAAEVAISGRVLTPQGSGLNSAAVYLTDGQGNTRTTRTSPFGYYRFENVGAGAAYVITVSAKRYRFSAQLITVKDDVIDLNFTAQ